MSDLREALEKALGVVEEGIARSTKPDREGFLMTSHVRQILAAAEVDPETGFARPLLDREAVRERIWRSLAGSGLTGIFRDELAEAQADAVMEMARPTPTREELLFALTKWGAGGWKYADAEGYRERLADSLAALLNGTES